MMINKCAKFNNLILAIKLFINLAQMNNKINLNENCFVVNEADSYKQDEGK